MLFFYIAMNKGTIKERQMDGVDEVTLFLRAGLGEGIGHAEKVLLDYVYAERRPTATTLGELLISQI